MSVSIVEPPRMAGAAPPRQIAEQLRRFIQLADAPPNAQSSLSDAGFILLTLKDQLIATDHRSTFFMNEFVQRPINGVDLLLKVVVALQGIVNQQQHSGGKLSILNRNSNNTNRKRKAAVAEADCIECLKIMLEKSPAAWRSLLDNPSGMEIVLFSVNSPQLDSKCYALEIILLLLEQPHGFTALFRALTTAAARSRDFLRLSLFVHQLKHGLHTAKLHIQILVVRLLNRLVLQAPTPVHRNLAYSEAQLAQFSADYVEKLVSEVQTPLGGVETLMEELSIWRSLAQTATSTVSMMSPRYQSEISSLQGSVNTNPIYGYTYSETESDTSKSDRNRRMRSQNAKFSTAGQTSVAKNIERQRQRRAAPSSTSTIGMDRNTLASSHTNTLGIERGLDRMGGGRAVSMSSMAFYPERQTNIMNKWQPESRFVQPSTTVPRAPQMGGMRRAKSESAMLIEDDLQMRPMPEERGGLRRVAVDPSTEYHPIEPSRHLSRSTHDLSREMHPAQTQSLLRPASAAPPPVSAVRTLPREPVREVRSEMREPIRQERAVSPRDFQGTLSPTDRALSPRARFADPPIVDAPHSHAGFSYLFPAAPVLPQASKRAVTPEPFSSATLTRDTLTREQPRPPSAPVFEQRTLSPDYNEYQPDYSAPHQYERQPKDEQVIYIPINVEREERRSVRGPLPPQQRYTRRDEELDSRASSRLRSPSVAGTIGEDVRDALSQFDYLNDYDSPRGSNSTRTATYHF